MTWSQVYDPMGNWLLSTALAALPVFVLLGSLAFLRMKAHRAAGLGLLSALIIAAFGFGMPGSKALAAAAYGAAYGLFPIGWIILNVIFLYDLADRRGLFRVLRDSLTGITRDRRLQLLLIAFSFGAFFEGAAGFGTPVAVTAAILIGLGFPPLQASGLSLIANTAPVAFGALGTPIVALAGVTGLDVRALSAMVGRQLPLFSVLIPFWLVAAFAGFAAMAEIWPALLVAGLSFGIVQFLVATFHGPWLAGVLSSVVSIAALVGFLRVWRPRRIWGLEGAAGGGGEAGNAEAGSAETTEAAAVHAHPRSEVVKAWLPWIILSLTVFVWGVPQVRTFLDGFSVVKISVPGLDKAIYRVPPVVPRPVAEGAVFSFGWLTFTGTGILIAALLSAAILRYRVREAAGVWLRTVKKVRFSLLTVAAMLALGYTCRYAGLDATLGLAFARTGVLYPFFGTMLGWLGVALTGSDTSSNVLFGSLQQISARQLGLDPVLMAAANSSGGVMGKMIDAQSIVVASTATKWYGREGDILRYVFFHSLALASLMGLLVLLQAYVF